MSDAAARAAATLRAAADALPAAALPAEDAAARRAVFERLASAAEAPRAAPPAPALLLAPRQVMQLKAQLKCMASLSRSIDVSPALLALAASPCSGAAAGAAGAPAAHLAHASAAAEVRSCVRAPSLRALCARLRPRRVRRAPVSRRLFPRSRAPDAQAQRRDGGGAAPAFDAAAVEGAFAAVPPRAARVAAEGFHVSRRVSSCAALTRPRVAPPAAAAAHGLPSPAALARRTPPAAAAPQPATPALSAAELRAEAQRRLASRIAARIAELDNLPPVRACCGAIRRCCARKATRREKTLSNSGNAISTRDAPAARCAGRQWRADVAWRAGDAGRAAAGVRHRAQKLRPSCGAASAAR